MRTVNAADTHAALRAWAAGMYSTVAGVELLIRAFDGRLAHSGLPWIKVEADGWAWVDARAAMQEGGALSGGEQRVLRIAASLLHTGIAVSLSDVLPGLDREVLSLVLAAVAHAGGSHEHSELVTTERDLDGQPRQARLVQLGSLYPWPKP